MKQYKIAFNISDFTDEELCEIYYALEHRKWPRLLGKKPDWWDASPYRLTGMFRAIRWKFVPNKLDATKDITSKIQKCIGQYRLLEYWWTHHNGRTKEEYMEFVLAYCFNAIS